MRVVFTLCLATLAARAPLAGQTQDAMKPLEYFVGSWTGEESASFGRGKGERTYRFILQGRYLISQNVSRFPPRESRPRGETHEDWTIFSYDAGRQTYIVRQFNSEGFVNHFALDAASSVPRMMRFVGESSENAPPGTRVTLEYEIVSENEFVERFDVAFPGAAQPMTIRNRWRRVAGSPPNARQP